MSLVEFYLWGVAISLFSGWIGYCDGYRFAKKQMQDAAKKGGAK